MYANNHSAFQPSIDLDLFGTGFGLNVWMSRANGSGFEDSEWLAYTAYYKGAFFVDEAYATHYKIGYTYFSYPDTPRAGNPLLPGTGDAQEIFGEFYWPNLLPGGIVPSYATFAYWPSESKSTVRNNGGWAHIFGLTKDISFEAIFGNQPEQVVHLGAHVVYNDAFGMAGKAADHDWSHAVFSPRPISIWASASCLSRLLLPVIVGRFRQYFRRVLDEPEACDTRLGSCFANRDAFRR